MKKDMFAYSAATDVGMVRKVNQDNFTVKTFASDMGQVGIFAVADGMGGLAEGEHAAAIAIEKIDEWVTSQGPSLFTRKTFELSIFKTQTEGLLKSINNAILTYAKSKEIQAGIAISLLVICKKKYYIFHAGDTRVYRLAKKKFFQLTEDETWVAEQVRSGLLSPEEALTHKKRHVLLNCLGVFEETRSLFFTGKARGKDIFLLCSDGLYNMVQPNEFSGLTAEKLITLANERGGVDNITAIVLSL